MAANSHHRGHKMWFDEATQLWRYFDDDDSDSEDTFSEQVGSDRPGFNQYVQADGTSVYAPNGDLLKDCKFG